MPIFSRAPCKRPALFPAFTAVVFLALLAGAGCSRGGDPARAALDDIMRAANAREAGSLLDRISPEFRAEDDSSRADVEATVRRLFAGYDSLRITVSDLTIERSEAAALARFRADLAGTPRAIGGLEGWLPRSSSYLFEARLAPSGDQWRVTWASWKEARSGGG